MSSREQNLELVRRWRDAFETQGFEAAEGLIDEVFDPEVEFSPFLAREIERRTLHGREELRAFFRDLNDMLGEVSYDGFEYQPIDDDMIVLLTRLVGTGRGSTVPIGQELGLVYEFEGGLVRRLTAYGSHEEALDAARMTRGPSGGEAEQGAV